jgi:hypothetical protein
MTVLALAIARRRYSPDIAGMLLKPPYSSPPQGSHRPIVLPAGATQSWFIAKVAIALSPILTFWTAGVIGWFLRRTLWQRSEAAPQSGRHPRDELAEARRSAQSPQ